VGHDGPISGVAASPNGLIATAGYDNRVLLWDGRVGLPIARGWHDHLANQCAFSQDGARLYSAGSDMTARVWRAPDMQLLQVLTGHADDVEMVAPNLDGSLTATCSRDGTIRLYDSDGAFRRRLDGHEADVISIAWIDGGDLLASSGDDGTIRLWRARDGEALAVHRFDGVETDTVAPVDPTLVFCGNDDGELITIRDGVPGAIKAHAAGVKRVAVDAAARRLIAASYDGEISLWRFDRAGALSLERRAAFPPSVWPRAVAPLPDGRLVFGSFRAGYTLYDPAADAWSAAADAAPYVNANALWRGPDGVYTVGDAGIVRRDGAAVGRAPSLCNVIAALGDRLIVGGQSGALYDARSGALLHRHDGPINVAVATDDGGLLIGGYRGGVDRLAPDGAGGLRLQTRRRLHDNAVKGLAVDGRVLFCVSASGAAIFADAHSLEITAAFPDGHTRIANGCASLGRGRFASVSRDRLLRLWDRAGAQEIATPHDHSIKSIAASADGRLIATGSYSGQLAIYAVEEERWIFDRRISFSGLPALEQGFGDELLCADYAGRVSAIDWRTGGAADRPSSRPAHEAAHEAAPA